MSKSFFPDESTQARYKALQAEASLLSRKFAAQGDVATGMKAAEVWQQVMLAAMDDDAHAEGLAAGAEALSLCRKLGTLGADVAPLHTATAGLYSPLLSTAGRLQEAERVVEEGLAMLGTLSSAPETDPDLAPITYVLNSARLEHANGDVWYVESALAAARAAKLMCDNGQLSAVEFADTLETLEDMRFGDDFGTAVAELDTAACDALCAPPDFDDEAFHDALARVASDLVLTYADSKNNERRWDAKDEPTAESLAVAAQVTAVYDAALPDAGVDVARAFVQWLGHISDVYTHLRWWDAADEAIRQACSVDGGHEDELLSARLVAVGVHVASCAENEHFDPLTQWHDQLREWAGRVDDELGDVAGTLLFVSKALHATNRPEAMEYAELAVDVGRRASSSGDVMATLAFEDMLRQVVEMREAQGIGAPGDAYVTEYEQAKAATAAVAKSVQDVAGADRSGLVAVVPRQALVEANAFKDDGELEKALTALEPGIEWMESLLTPVDGGFGATFATVLSLQVELLVGLGREKEALVCCEKALIAADLVSEGHENTYMRVASVWLTTALRCGKADEAARLAHTVAERWEELANYDDPEAWLLSGRAVTEVARARFDAGLADEALVLSTAAFEALVFLVMDEEDGRSVDEEHEALLSLLNLRRDALVARGVDHPDFVADGDALLEEFPRNQNDPTFDGYLAREQAAWAECLAVAGKTREASAHAKKALRLARGLVDDIAGVPQEHLVAVLGHVSRANAALGNEGLAKKFADEAANQT